MSEQTKNSEWFRNHFLYPNGTLKNKLNITDAQVLQDKEYIGSAIRSLVFLRQHKTIKTVDDLCKIHKIMFGWLYNWAGEVRDYQLMKGSTEFLEASRIPYGIEEINEKLASLKNQKEISSYDYAFLLDRLNYLHPFREGNGRSSKLFLQAFAQNHGQIIDYPRSNKKIIEAQNNADINELAKLIKVEKSHSES